MSIEILKDMLKDIGLNNLESEIYITLVQMPGITGYKIAGLISKAIANTYKALNQLENKGLVVCSESDGSKAYSAIQIDEYLDRLEYEFSEKRKNIVLKMNEIKTKQTSFGNYNLTDKNQVFERAKTMINNAKNVLLVDVFPKPYDQIKISIDKRIEDKGLDIRLKLYNQDNSDCKNVINAFNGEEIVNESDGSWLIVCRDSVESLICVFNKDTDELIHAVWSTDPFLCLTLYNGLANEFMLIEVIAKSYQIPDMYNNFIKDIHLSYNRLFSYESVIINKIIKDLFVEIKKE